MTTTLVELCAGSAAVSLRWLHPRAKPPIAYQGGKRAYADAILLAMGLRPGGGQRDGRVVLVEAGPWGEAWAHWAAGGIPDTVARLRAWASEDPRALWTRLKDAPVPAGRAERVAVWAMIQRGSFGGFPAFVIDGRWRWSQRAGRATPHTSVGPRMEIDAVDVAEIARRVGALPSLSRAEVRHGDARAVEPVPGAIVVIDPPYVGTTGYGCSLSRDEVIGLAQRWRSVGAAVAVCESEPLPIAGWHAHQIASGEWLTMSQRPVGVLNFGPVAIGSTS